MHHIGSSRVQSGAEPIMVSAVARVARDFGPGLGQSRPFYPIDEAKIPARRPGRLGLSQGAKKYGENGTLTLAKLFKGASFVVKIGLIDG